MFVPEIELCIAFVKISLYRYINALLFQIITLRSLKLLLFYCILVREESFEASTWNLDILVNRENYVYSWRMSSLTSLNPVNLGTTSSSGDKLGDLVDKLEKTKIVNGDEESNHVGAPGRYIKHPLQNAWTLWFFKNDKSRTWEENQRPIITVTTVEDFWSLYNHIEVASKLPAGADYSIFKEGIFPDWEDPRNQDGGRWIISLDKKFKQELLDTYWLEIIFFLIGEHADQHAHQVNCQILSIEDKNFES